MVDNTHGVKEFRSCIEHLDMEDVAMNGLFFTWVQKRKDPESGIMKKLDKIMGNSDFLISLVMDLLLFFLMLLLITVRLYSRFLI